MSAVRTRLMTYIDNRFPLKAAFKENILKIYIKHTETIESSKRWQAETRSVHILSLFVVALLGLFHSNLRATCVTLLRCLAILRLSSSYCHVPPFPPRRVNS